MRKDLLVETISKVCSKRLKLCLLTPKNEDFAMGIGLQLQQLNRTISQECSLEDNNGQHLRHPLDHLMRSSNKFWVPLYGSLAWFSSIWNLIGKGSKYSVIPSRHIWGREPPHLLHRTSELLRPHIHHKESSWLLSPVQRPSYIYPCVSLLQEVAVKTSFTESGEGLVMIRNSSGKTTTMETVSPSQAQICPVSSVYLRLLLVCCCCLLLLSTFCRRSSAPFPFC
jgi:hypothetical protein